MRRLVVAGASVLHRDRFGNTPLHLACRDGAFECAKALLFPISQEERRAALLPLNGIPQPLPQDLEQRNYDGMSRFLLFPCFCYMCAHRNIKQDISFFGLKNAAQTVFFGRDGAKICPELPKVVGIFQVFIFPKGKRWDEGGGQF